jgi:biopolymer transport protein ExbB/TolQ
MNFSIEAIGRQFNAGGPFMWVILFVLAFATAVVIERAIFYFILCAGKAQKLVAAIAGAINDNRIEDAKRVAGTRRAPVNVLLSTAVDRYGRGMSFDEIQEAVEETAIKEVPRLSQRLNYLALFANIATLLGLLGTIAGLQVSFSSLATVEAAKKATMLARGISQAMNTTAFGLIVAVPCMIFYTALNNKQQALTKDLDEAVVKLMNFLKKKRAQ